MNNNCLLGVGSALITPFNQSGSVDFKSILKILKHIKNYVHYIVVLGTTSESSTLNKKEKKEIIEFIKQNNMYKLPIVIGIGGNNTSKVIKNINRTNLDGIEFILSVSPYYNKPSQEGIYNHFKEISKKTNKKIIIYNVPTRTGSNVEPDTVVRLAKDCNNIIAIKEASGDLLQSYEIIRKKPKKFIVISGDDNLTLPIFLGGGGGVISVISQGLPYQYYKMFNFLNKNKIQEAFNIYYKIMKIIKLVFKHGNPTGIKTMLHAMNLCENFVRLPLMCGDNDLKAKIKSEYYKITSLY